jgi:hypothetical protein
MIRIYFLALKAPHSQSDTTQLFWWQGEIFAENLYVDGIGFLLCAGMKKGCIAG